jgi:TonB family protein
MSGARIFMAVPLLAASLLACRRGTQAPGPSRFAQPVVASAPASDTLQPNASPVYEIGGEVSAPVILEQVRPVMPEQVRNQHIVQQLYLYNIVVNEVGRVSSVSLLRGNTSAEPYISYDRAFREAIFKWRYSPAMRAGKPVSVNVTVSATAEVQ